MALPDLTVASTGAFCNSFAGGLRSPWSKKVKEINMNQATAGAVASKIDRVRAAHAKGDLAAYKPLVASGADHAKATATASWGPAMRR